MTARKTPDPKKVRGILITPAGEGSSIDVEHTVRALWEVVGGDVERIPLRQGADLFANRQSRGLPARRNETAEKLVSDFGVKQSRLVVIGNALVLGAIKPTGDSTDVPGWVRERLTRGEQL